MKLIMDDGQEYDIQHVEAAELFPDDVVIVNSEEKLSDNTIERIWEKMKSVFPGNQLLIMDGGLDLEILRLKTNGTG